MTIHNVIYIIVSLLLLITLAALDFSKAVFLCRELKRRATYAIINRTIR